MQIVLCTLFEGDYHLGAAALLNSLHQSGFTGRFYCGYRGARPAWAEHTSLVEPIRVHWIELTTDVHLTNHKPAFLEAILDVHAPDAEAVAYLDPDIVVKAPWPVVARWIGQDGVALCEDINASLPAGHPYRLGWLEFLRRKQLTPVRSLDRYYNAGFVGLIRRHRSLLRPWQDLIDAAHEETGSLKRLKNSGPHALFHSADQDALNMALLLDGVPIHATGPEGMDFLPGGHLLSHAAGGIKPWRGGFLRAALGGHPPGTAQKQFHRFAQAPLTVLPAGKLAIRRWELSAAAFLGRFYRRA